MSEIAQTNIVRSQEILGPQLIPLEEADRGHHHKNGRALGASIVLLGLPCVPRTGNIVFEVPLFNKGITVRVAIAIGASTVILCSAFAQTVSDTEKSASVRHFSVSRHGQMDLSGGGCPADDECAAV